MSALAELHATIVARLKADAGVTALVGAKVFDKMAPTGTAKPFVTVGALTGVEEGSALDHVGFGHTATVDAFADGAEGPKQVYAVAKAVQAALRARLTLTGHSSTRLRLEFETEFEEPDGTRHVPMRFRTFAMETA